MNHLNIYSYIDSKYLIRYTMFKIKLAVQFRDAYCANNRISSWRYLKE